MKIEEIEMTPALAAKLLEQNTVNRLLSPPRVNALADAIDRGDWLADANPIKLGDDGTLIDGQHRLHAIVKAGKAVTCLLATGVPAIARLSVDTGRPRSLADYMRMNAVKAATDAAAAARLLYWYQSEPGAARFTYADIAQLWEFYRANEEQITEAIHRSRAVYYHVRSIQRSVMSVAWIIFSGIDNDDAEAFWWQLRGDEKPSPAANALCSFGSSRQLSAGHYEQRYSLAITIKAWNAYRRGAEVKMLMWKPSANERFPEPK